VRCRPVAIELIDQILHRTKGEPGQDLRRLAEEVGALNLGEARRHSQPPIGCTGKVRSTVSGATLLELRAPS
jgi:hypothetical protein